MTALRVGVLVLPADPWPDAVARVQRLEALGFDHLWTYDHLSWRRYRERPWHAAIPWLTGMAAATTRLRLGTMVASPNFRHPVTLAKEAMTLDHVSSGRLTLGLGSGGTGFDATVLGTDPLSPRDRAARFVEFTELVDELLRAPRTTRRGRWYTVEEARMIPGCVQQPRVPLAVAASGPTALDLAARVADMWITYGPRDGHDADAAEVTAAVRRQLDTLERACQRAGRDPATLERLYMMGNTGERPLASTAAFADSVGRFADLGFTDVVFHHPRPGDPVWDEPEEIVEAIAVEVLPLLQRR